MTEQEWMTSNDPAAMLDFLRGGNPLRAECPAPPPSDRKLRLFACACCRASGVKPQIVDDYEVVGGPPHFDEWKDGKWIEPMADAEWAMSWAVKRVEQSGEIRAAIMRDIFGNPWRPAQFTWDVLWLSVQEIAKIKGTAQAIYDDRTFGDLPVLTDLLEEAGCTATEKCERCDGLGSKSVTGWKYGKAYYESCDYCNDTGSVPHPIIAHLRGHGPHVRGCWCLDLILGKE